MTVTVYVFGPGVEVSTGLVIVPVFNTVLLGENVEAPQRTTPERSSVQLYVAVTA
jgi:hypothetical protein